MRLHVLGIGQRIAQLHEREVAVLRDQFLKESLVRCQLCPAARRSLRCGRSMTLGPNLTRPSSTCGGRNLQAQCRRTPV